MKQEMKAKGNVGYLGTIFIKAMPLAALALGIFATVSLDMALIPTRIALISFFASEIIAGLCGFAIVLFMPCNMKGELTCQELS